MTLPPGLGWHGGHAQEHGRALGAASASSASAGEQALVSWGSKGQGRELTGRRPPGQWRAALRPCPRCPHCPVGSSAIATDRERGGRAAVGEPRVSAPRRGIRWRARACSVQQQARGGVREGGGAVSPANGGVRFYSTGHEKTGSLSARPCKQSRVLSGSASSCARCGANCRRAFGSQNGASRQPTRPGLGLAAAAHKVGGVALVRPHERQAVPVVEQHVRACHLGGRVRSRPLSLRSQAAPLKPALSTAIA